MNWPSLTPSLKKMMCSGRRPRVTLKNSPSRSFICAGGGRRRGGWEPAGALGLKQGRFVRGWEVEGLARQAP